MTANLWAKPDYSFAKLVVVDLNEAPLNFEIDLDFFEQRQAWVRQRLTESGIPMLVRRPVDMVSDIPLCPPEVLVARDGTRVLFGIEAGTS